MKVKKITFLIVFSLLVLMIIPNFCNAEVYYDYQQYDYDYNYENDDIYDTTYYNDYDYYSSEYDYYISNYDINMIVNEDNTFDITETITANFNVDKHGIFRKIPLRNTVTRVDGTTSSNRAKISDIYVNENYYLSTEDGYKVIKIGNPDITLTGSHTYTIKYKYDIGEDPLKNVDELYFNLIGNEWDTYIEKVNFKITMPKSFDKSLLGFSSGYIGSIDSSNILYGVNENVITGYTISKLNYGEALTVRLILPEGYFIVSNLKNNIYPIIVIIISLIFVLIADRLWTKYGKDEEVIETVEFYPPEGYNSAEVGFLYKGSVDSKGVISLLIYLANKGYLKIEEIEAEGLFKKKEKSFKITKLKEYDGENESEKIFFNGLFKAKKSIDLAKVREIMKEAKNNGEKISFTDAAELARDDFNKDSVTEEDLYDNFYITLNKVMTKINSKKNKDKIIESTSKGKTGWIVLMSIIVFLLITIKTVIEYSDFGDGDLPLALMFTSIGYICIICFAFSDIKPKIVWIIFGLIFGGSFAAAPLVLIIIPALMQNGLYAIMYILGVICITINSAFIKYMPKRTPFGNEMLGKLRGFKRFLETAEKVELESLVEKNPEYFYNILPYTYALGVSDKWISQFESIAMQAPDWYDSPDGFNMSTFGTFMTTTMRSAEYAMTSSPSSDSGGGGGGSSGGGSSGGGSGGGGGGSW